VPKRTPPDASADSAWTVSGDRLLRALPGRRCGQRVCGAGPRVASRTWPPSSGLAPKRPMSAPIRAARARQSLLSVSGLELGNWGHGLGPTCCAGRSSGCERSRFERTDRRAPTSAYAERRLRASSAPALRTEQPTLISRVGQLAGQPAGVKDAAQCDDREPTDTVTSTSTV